MLTEYLDKKLAQARFKRLKDGSYFGEISGVRGVWANARTLTACRSELREVLEDWLVLKVRSGEMVTGLSFKTDRRSLVK
jgi:predicted RNase H-like HicB family nuclease